MSSRINYIHSKLKFLYGCLKDADPNDKELIKLITEAIEAFEDEYESAIWRED